MLICVLLGYRLRLTKHLKRETAMRKVRNRSQEAADGFAGAGVVRACPKMKLQFLLKPLGVVNLTDDVQVAFGQIDIQRNGSGQDGMIASQLAHDLKFFHRLVSLSLTLISLTQIGKVEEIEDHV
ncbi:hypothetical protein D3C74_337050 [compost metagenome]